MRCLRHVVPASVPGIAFLSGGQSGELASARLNAMNLLARSPEFRLPWALTFLVCSRDPASGPGYLARPGRQRPGGAASSGASRQMQPGALSVANIAAAMEQMIDSSALSHPAR